MISLRFVIKYISHQLKAHSAHGLHSPLAYSIYQKVIKQEGPSQAPGLLEAIRGELLQDNRSIQVIDLGAGSLHKSGESRKISSIAKHALKPKSLASFLYRLAAWHKPDVVIELGTSLGLTSAYLAKALPGSRIISIEGSPEIAAEARKVHTQAGVTVEVFEGNFDDILPGVLESLLTDNFMLYIDGNHQYQATLNYFNLAMKKAGEKTLIVFDDIHWSEGMEKAWQEIKENTAVSFTADIFFLGFILTESNRAKQDFKMRFI